MAATQDKIAEKHQRVIDMLKCMRLAMKDAAAANDKHVREAYRRTADRWGDKIDAELVQLELLKLSQDGRKKYVARECA